MDIYIIGGGVIVKKIVSITCVCISVLLLVASIILTNDYVQSTIAFDAEKILPLLAIINMSLIIITILLNKRTK